MKITKKVVAIIISTIILLMININKSNASTTGVITEISVRLRESPTTSSKMLTFVTQDDKVEVIEKDGDWYKIKYKNYTGYVLGEYIKIEDESKLEEKDKDPEENNEQNEEKNEISNQEENTEPEDSNNTTDLDKEYKLSKNKKISIIPNINASIIYVVKEDTKIKIIQELSNWSYIEINSITGWVRNDQIEEISKTEGSYAKQEGTEEKKEESKKIGYIKYDKVNLRKDANTNSKILARLTLNTEIIINKSYDDSWYEVEVNGNTGYISKDLVSDEKQNEDKVSNAETTSRSDNSRADEMSEESKKDEEKVEDKSVDVSKEEKNNEDTNKTMNNSKSENNTVTGEDIVKYAKTFLGCKYVYGGTSPKGFDCSGLTYYVYKNFGYKINRSSSAQAKNGVYVAKSDLCKGDLVFFRKLGTTGNTIGHVGIYIGDDKFIEASDYSTGVIISSLSKKNYKDRYITARRILDN